MNATQISIFLENKKGRLASAVKALAENNINMRALNIADTAEFGVLRIIVDKPEEAEKCLKASGFAAKKTEVMAVLVPDVPGGLSKVLSVLEAAGVSVEYLYAYLARKGDHAVTIFRVDDTKRAAESLKKAGIDVVTDKELQEI